MTDAEHKAALNRIDALMGAVFGTSAADELAALADVVAEYESRHFPLEIPTPFEMERFRAEQMEGLNFKPESYHDEPDL